MGIFRGAKKRKIMIPASVYTLFFSPTGTTARTADAIAAALARNFSKRKPPVTLL